MAKHSTRLEFSVGIVFVVAIVMLVLGIMWGKSAALSLDRRTVTFTFDNASGVSTSTPIYLHGVKVGDVTDVRALDDHAEVVAEINRDIEIYDDAHALIRIMELTGGKKIELIPGDGLLRVDADPIPGRNEGDIGELIAVFQNIATELSPVMRRADSLLTDLSGIIGDPELQRDIRTTLDQFASSGTQLNALLRDNSQRVTRTMVSLEGLTNDLRGMIDRNEQGIDRIVASTQTLTTDANLAVGDARALIARTDKTVQRLEELMGDLTEGDGLMTKLLYDEKFSARLEQTVEALRVLLLDFRRDGVNVNMEVGHKHKKKDE